MEKKMDNQLTRSPRKKSKMKPKDEPISDASAEQQHLPKRSPSGPSDPAVGSKPLPRKRKRSEASRKAAAPDDKAKSPPSLLPPPTSEGASPPLSSTQPGSGSQQSPSVVTDADESPTSGRVNKDVSGKSDGARVGSQGRRKRTTPPTLRSTFSKVLSKITRGKTAGTTGAGDLRADEKHILKCTSLAVALVLLLLVTLVFVFHGLTSYFQHRPQLDCLTPECIRIKTEMKNLLNTSIHPCDDFYGFVCGHWVRSNDSGFLDDAVGNFYDIIASRIKTVDLARPDRSGTRPFVQLYNACFKFMSEKSSTLKDVVDHTSSFLNIAAVINALYFPVLIGELMRISFTTGIQSVFAIRFERVGKNKLLHISVGSAIDGKIRELFKQMQLASTVDVGAYIKDLLDITHVDQGSKTMAEELAEIDRKFDGYYTQAPVRKTEYMAFSSLSNVLGELPLSEFLQLLNSFTPTYLHVGTQSDVYVTGSDLIIKTRDAMYNMNYSVRAIYSAINLITDVSQYTLIRSSTAARGSRTETFVCLTITQNSFTHTGPRIVSSLSGYEGSSGQVKGMSDTIKEDIVRNKKLQWMDDFSLGGMKKFMTVLTYKVYDPSQLDNMSSEVDYSSLSLKELDFVHAYLQMRTFETRLLLRHLPTQESFALSKYQLLEHPSADQRLKFIAVPTTLQVPPIFFFREKEVPLYFNYATLGTLVAVETIRSLRLAYDWGLKSRERFDRTVSCLGNLRGYVNTTRELNVSVWGPRAFDLSYGALVSYEAVRRIMSGTGRSSVRTWQDAQMIFFIRSCMLFCSSRKSGRPLLPQEECLLAVQSNADFSALFECSTRSKFRAPSCVSSLFSDSP